MESTFDYRPSLRKITFANCRFLASMLSKTALYLHLGFSLMFFSFDNLQAIRSHTNTAKYKHYNPQLVRALLHIPTPPKFPALSLHIAPTQPLDPERETAASTLIFKASSALLVVTNWAGGNVGQHLSLEQTELSPQHPFQLHMTSLDKTVSWQRALELLIIQYSSSSMRDCLTCHQQLPCVIAWQRFNHKNSHSFGSATEVEAIRPINSSFTNFLHWDRILW